MTTPPDLLHALKSKRLTTLTLPLCVGFLYRQHYTYPEELFSWLFMKSHRMHFLSLPQAMAGRQLDLLLMNDAVRALQHAIRGQAAEGNLEIEPSVSCEVGKVLECLKK
jgi:hypothetical protein